MAEPPLPPTTTGTRRAPRVLAPHAVIRTLLVAVGVLVVSVLVAADGGGDAEAELAELRRELAARESAEEVLIERITALEALVVGLPGDDQLTALAEAVDELAGPRVEGLDHRIDELAERTDEVEAAAAAVAEAHRQLDGQLEATADELRGAIGGVRGGVEELRSETADLRTLYDVLRDRVDRLAR